MNAIRSLTKQNAIKLQCVLHGNVDYVNRNINVRLLTEKFE